MTKPPAISRRFLAAVALGLLTATFAMCRLRPIYWSDVWWHLGVGEYITAHHQIPTVDVFSWTLRGASWINTEWLYEIILFGITRAMGLAGIIFLKTALMLVALYFVDLRLRFWKSSVFERLLCLSLVFLGSWPFWVERPDLASLALLSALFCELDRGGFRAAGEWTRGLLWVGLFCLWPNIHGLFPAGLLVMGLRGLLLLRRHPGDGRRMLLWTILCAAATIANPYGIGLLPGIFRNMSGNFTKVYEWLPPIGPGFLFFYAALVLTLLSFCLKKRSRDEEDLFAAIVVLLFAGYALRHLRFIHFFMVCAFPYAARAWLATPWRKRLSGQFMSWEKPALIGSVLLLLVSSLMAAHLIQGGVNAVDSGYIKEACDFIAFEKIEGPFYNDYKFGSYWIWRFKGNPPVFQDGRQASVLGYDRLNEEVLRAQESPETWNDYMDRMGIQAALVRYPSESHGIKPAPFDHYFPRTSWGLIYWDDQSLLFVRRTKSHAKALRRFEYRTIKPEWTLESFQDQLQRGLLNRAAARAELMKNLSLNPNCWRAQVDLHWLDRYNISSHD